MIDTSTRIVAIEREERLSHQTSNRGKLNIATTEETSGLNVFLVVVAFILQRVNVRVVPRVRLDVYTTILLIGVRDSGHLTGCVEHTGSGVVVLIGECHASTNLYNLVDDVIYVQTAVVAVHGVALLETLVEHGGK